MRTSSMLATAVVAMLLSTGCSSLVSLNPTSTDKDDLVLPGLAGAWAETDGDGVYVIALKGVDYTLTYTEKSESHRLQGRLWKAGDAFLLDLVSKEDQPLHVPVHFVVRVWLSGNSLQVAILDSDWIKRFAAERLQVQTIDNRSVITTPNPALRAFYSEFGADERAYKETGTLKRME